MYHRTVRGGILSVGGHCGGEKEVRGGERGKRRRVWEGGDGSKPSQRREREARWTYGEREEERMAR